MTRGLSAVTIRAMRSPEPIEANFVSEWNSLPARDRRRVRRLVRLGRPLADPQETALASTYARFQRSRPWMRFFWVWFVPGAVLALGVAASLHPIVVGAVLVLTGEAVYAHHNLGKAARLATNPVDSPHIPPAA